MIKLILFIITISASLFAIDITGEKVNITASAYYLEDKSRMLDLAEIKKHRNAFTAITESSKNFGFTASAIWIRVLLENPSNEAVKRYIISEEHLLNSLSFYVNNKVQKEGLEAEHQTHFLQPAVSVTLTSHSSQELFIKIISPTNPITLKLISFNEEEIYEKAFHEQVFFALFFGVLLALILYNLALFSLIRKKINFYYVGYLISIMLFYLGSTGMDRVYLYKEASELFSYIGVYLIGFMTLMVILFSYEFMAVHYSWVRRYFQGLGALVVISMLVMLYPPFYTIVIPVVLGIISVVSLLLLALSTLKRSNRTQAMIYLLGWAPIIISFLIMTVDKFFGMTVIEHFYHIEQFAILFEAVVFSFALAVRIKSIDQERLKVQSELILQQKNSHSQLEEEVDKRTLELQQRLLERDVILREIHHRTKNNMQIVISMLRLQSDQHDEHFKKLITTAENRISSMLSVHDSLFTQKDFSKVDVTMHFEKLIRSIVLSLGCEQKNISFTYACELLDIDILMMLGLVINELISNACIHTQMRPERLIHIDVKCDDASLILEVQDNGTDVIDTYNEGLGLMLVRSIVQEQWQGDFSIRYQKGTLARVVVKKEYQLIEKSKK